MEYEDIKYGVVTLVIKDRIFNRIIRREKVTIAKLLWTTNLCCSSAKMMYEACKREIEKDEYEYGVDYSEDYYRYLSYNFDTYSKEMKLKYNIEIKSENEYYFFGNQINESGSCEEDKIKYIDISKTEDIETLVLDINNILKLDKSRNYHIELI